MPHSVQPGLFFFGSEYRPVPLTQYYLGVTEPHIVKRRAKMNDICFQKLLQNVQQHYQVILRKCAGSF